MLATSTNALYKSMALELHGILQRDERYLPARPYRCVASADARCVIACRFASCRFASKWPRPGRSLMEYRCASLDKRSSIASPDCLLIVCRCTSAQGLTFVHISAQRKRFLWDRGCV